MRDPPVARHRQRPSNNIIIGSSDANVLTGNGGDDTLTGGGGIDMAAYGVGIEVDAKTDISYDATRSTWIVTASEGKDTLSGMEVIDDASGGRTLLVGAGGFATIQAAINAAADGDTIIVAPGTYDESVTVNKDVTLLGANFGHPGNGARGDESVITGCVQFTAAGAGAELNGFEIAGTSGFGAGLDRPVGVLIGADNVNVTNNVMTGSADDTRPSTFQWCSISRSITIWSPAGAKAPTSRTDHGSITHNVFEHNGNGVVSESTHVDITDNSFGSGRLTYRCTAVRRHECRHLRPLTQSMTTRSAST